MSSRRPRIRASRRPSRHRRSRAPPGGRTGSARQRRHIAVQPGGIPAADGAIERVGARPDRLVRTAPPVGEVVTALVPGPRPVRDLVAAEPGVRQGTTRRAGTGPRRGPRPGPGARRPATGAPRASSAGDRRRARRAPPRPGRPASARTATGGRARGRAPRRASPVQVASEPSGMSYSRSRLTEPMPAVAAPSTASATSAARWRRPSRRNSPSSSDWAPNETRVMPARRQAAGSPRSSGPGLASSVTSAPAATPNRVAHSREQPLDVVGGSSDGVPPPR